MFTRPDPATGEPWQIAPDAYPTQRLYRVKYRGPEGHASFKLTLYLGGVAEYRMTASDGLGRKLWSLQVDGDRRALWLDHRRKEYCRAQAAERLLLVPLARLPLVALPRLLLGRMPAEPAASLVRGDGHLAYLDARGQRWVGVLRDGQLDWWRLEEAGEAIAWWRRDGDGSSFTDQRGGQEIEWREIVREQLQRPVEPLEVPARFREGMCGEAPG